MSRWRKVVIATVLGLVGFTMIPAHGISESNLCFQEDEILADVLYQFLLSQAIVAQRCDALTLESQAERGSGRFFQMHGLILGAHQAEFDAMVPMDEILGRQKFGDMYKNPNKTPHLGSQTVAAVTFSATPGKCEAFMNELEKRHTSFDRIRTEVLNIFATEKKAYPRCKGLN